MGGCRCYFRDCHVNSYKFPSIHFFRFPLKEQERFKKWRQYAKMERMLEFTEVRRKNTSICGRHFRTECFMNYKMDSLVPSAVPTIMRLSETKALDFESDVENGVLVTLEKPKLKHLIPPDGFELPLFLMYDNVLLEKLNELESSNPGAQLTDSERSLEYENFVLEKPKKSLANSVQILETIQVTGPNLKRSRNVGVEENPSTSAGIIQKRSKILNNTNCRIENNLEDDTSIVLPSKSVQQGNCTLRNDEIGVVEIDRFENGQEFMNCEKELYVRNEAFINDDSEETEVIEFFEVQRDDNSPQHYPKAEDGSRVEILSQELRKVQNELLEFKKKCKDFEVSQVRFSILEEENNELKKRCEENSEIKKELLCLQIENNNLKKELNGYETLKNKYHICREENKQLMESNGTIKDLKAEILSRKEETKELKRLLENVKPKDQRCKKYDKLNIESGESASKIMKLTEELNVLQEKLVLKSEEFNVAESEVLKVKKSLNDMKTENEKLMQYNNELEELLKIEQTSYDTKYDDNSKLKLDYDMLKKEYSTLNQKYLKLQSSKNQESIVSTSLQITGQKPKTEITPSTLANSLTKAQLFNGIKRYVSASMVALLRMEMFGGSERAWKNDERQVSVDILRLGETVYKYFTEEWRLRLPSLRDVRNWQSQQILKDEEDP